MSISLRTLALAAPLGLALTVLPVLPASAGDGIERAGTCSRASSTEIKVSHDDGRIEVEGEVDSNRVGQRWNWRIVRVADGTVLHSGRATTVAPSGSFTVERRVANRPGTETLRFRAVNPVSGEVCSAQATI